MQERGLAKQLLHALPGQKDRAASTRLRWPAAAWARERTAEDGIQGRGRPSAFLQEKTAGRLEQQEAVLQKQPAASAEQASPEKPFEKVAASKAKAWAQVRHKSAEASRHKLEAPYVREEMWAPTLAGKGQPWAQPSLATQEPLEQRWP